MTNQQHEKLIEVLERIAKALESKREERLNNERIAEERKQGKR